LTEGEGRTQDNVSFLIAFPEYLPPPSKAENTDKIYTQIRKKKREKRERKRKSYNKRRNNSHNPGPKNSLTPLSKIRTHSCPVKRITERFTLVMSSLLSRSLSTSISLVSYHPILSGVAETDQPKKKK
jgi:hypothetical protein